MIIATYETGHTLQYFEGKGYQGGSLAVVFSPDGEPIFYFEAERAVNAHWPEVQGAINAFVFRDEAQRRGEL